MWAGFFSYLGHHHEDRRDRDRHAHYPRRAEPSGLGRRRPAVGGRRPSPRSWRTALGWDGAVVGSGSGPTLAEALLRVYRWAPFPGPADGGAYSDEFPF